MNLRPILNAHASSSEIFGELSLENRWSPKATVTVGDVHFPFTGTCSYTTIIWSSLSSDMHALRLQENLVLVVQASMGSVLHAITAYLIWKNMVMYTTG